MSCSSRLSKDDCEKSGLLAKIANCRWSGSFCHHASSFPSANEMEKKLPPAAPKATMTTSTKSNTQKLPKSPSDCEVPACQTKTSAFARLIQKPRSTKKEDTAAQTRNSSTIVTTPEELARTGQCPAGREDLGWQSWTLLHSIAAYYPDQPTSEDRTRARQFVESVGHLYPCTHCAEAFREDLKEVPVRLETRTSFSVWMCRMHNRVNSKLGKTEYPCTIDALDARWRRNPSCEAQDDEDAESSLQNTNY